MSVYISGLKIPQDGRVTLQIDSNGGVYVVNKFSITAEKYEKSMTAIGIKPHGRLIDADKIEYEKLYIDDVGKSYEMVGKDDIDDADTVIEAEGSEE